MKTVDGRSLWLFCNFYLLLSTEVNLLYQGHKAPVHLRLKIVKSSFQILNLIFVARGLGKHNLAKSVPFSMSA